EAAAPGQPAGVVLVSCAAPGRHHPGAGARAGNADLPDGWVMERAGVGAPLFLVSYRDLPVEEDTVPLRLLDREPGAPRALGEVVGGRQELWRRFAMWLHALQPGLWEEIQHMATTTGVIDWEALGKTTNLGEVVRFLPPERVIQELGVERAIQA